MGSTTAFEEMLDGLALVEAWYDGEFYGGKSVREIAEKHSDVQLVKQHIFNTDRLSDVRTQIDKLVVPAWERLLEQLLKNPDSGWDQDRIDRVIKDMKAESEEGTYIPLDIYVCVVQKKGRLK